jgi:eukaryotic-like serine/threonine-protein kinase
VPVAAKFLAQTLLNQKMRDRFEKEAKTCAGLGQRSMHIVRVTDYDADDDDIPYYIMEYLKGESLSDIISRQPLPLPRFVSLTRQICWGLQCAHQGIEIEGEVYPVVHRDIKPSNILVIQDDSYGELAKILDFGIAKVLQADSGQTNCFMGTLAYASPEQMEGHELDGRSDIYSLGVVMFQMLTGKMPLHVDTHTFGGWYRAHHHQAPRSFESANSNVKLPKALENLVLSCLSKSPGDRPQSVNEVIKALEPFERKYRPGLELGKDIEDFIDGIPINPTPPIPSSISPDQICRLASWPPGKPHAEIFFPNAIRTTKEVLATLWVMLTQQEIEKRRVCTRYNHFLFMPSPHPTILWLTVLYNREHGPRWLPCYLDLKTHQGQKMTRLLGDVGRYRILFFAQNAPQKCADVVVANINPAQCRQLTEWATKGQMAQMAPNTTYFNLSKNHLKNELERLKPQIIRKLDSFYE